MAKPRDKKTGRPSGFEESPQASFEGAPVDLKGPVSSSIEQLEGETRTVSNDEINARAARAEETRRIRSEAGKHRLKAAKGGQKGDQLVEISVQLLEKLSPEQEELVKQLADSAKLAH